MVCDKTGTLTRGEPEVTDVVTHDFDPNRLLALAAGLERESEHPLAGAVVAEADRVGAAVLRADRFENVRGQGATAVVDGRDIVIGSRRLLHDREIDTSALDETRTRLAETGRTAIFVAVDGRAAAVLGIADAPRPTAAATVAALRQRGIQVVMLTGDNEATARRIAEGMGIERVIADVLPSEKANHVAELQRAGAKVAMVGDGVNDAPALAQADLGIAIGAGTDVAIETADVVLMRSDPLDIVVVLSLGRATLRKMRQNLGWAIGYNSLAIPVAAGVFVPAFGLMLRPEIAALTMSGSSFLVAVNALLLKRLDLPKPDEIISPAATRQLAFGS